CLYFFYFQAEDGIRVKLVTGVQTCALPICGAAGPAAVPRGWLIHGTGSNPGATRRCQAHPDVGWEAAAGSWWCTVCPDRRSAGRSEERRVGKEWSLRWCREPRTNMNERFTQ